MHCGWETHGTKLKCWSSWQHYSDTLKWFEFSTLYHCCQFPLLLLVSYRFVLYIKFAHSKGKAAYDRGSKPHPTLTLKKQGASLAWGCPFLSNLRTILFFPPFRNIIECGMNVLENKLKWIINELLDRVN